MTHFLKGRGTLHVLLNESEILEYKQSIAKYEKPQKDGKAVDQGLC